MKANPQLSPAPTASSGMLARAGSHAAIGAALLVLAGCAERPAPPTPTGQQSPAPRPSAAPPPPVTADWRDMPTTPGTWQWSTSGGASRASFASGHLVLTCDPRTQTVALLRAASGTSGAVGMAVTTTNGTRTLTAHTVPGGVEVTLPARDPLLDAMAFSRGRFAVLAAGLAPLYVPSWTEVSRVVEDCR